MVFYNTIIYVFNTYMNKNIFLNGNFKFNKIKFNWINILITLIILWLFIFIYNFNKPKIEGLTNSSKFIVKKKDDIYDDFYTEIYDKLLYADYKNKFEVKEIIKITNLKKTSKLLDIGSGTGHIVEEFNKNNINSIGLDNSKSMIKKSKENYPNNTYKLGSALQSNIFPLNYFDAITCLFFTIYYFKNKSIFFQNCYNWIKPGGILIINLVNRDKFDPVIPISDPFYVSPKSVTNKRITNSNVIFDNMKYKSDFKLDGSIGTFNEKFISNDGTVRENQHKLYMDKQSEILSIAKSKGFIYLAKIDLNPIEYDHQYLYILRKPN